MVKSKLPYAILFSYHIQLIGHLIYVLGNFGLHRRGSDLRKDDYYRYIRIGAEFFEAIMSEYIINPSIYIKAYPSIAGIWYSKKFRNSLCGLTFFSLIFKVSLKKNRTYCQKYTLSIYALCLRSLIVRYNFWQDFRDSH